MCRSEPVHVSQDRLQCRAKVVAVVPSAVYVTLESPLLLAPRAGLGQYMEMLRPNLGRSLVPLLPLLVVLGCGEDPARSDAGSATSGDGLATSSETQATAPNSSLSPTPTTTFAPSIDSSSGPSTEGVSSSEAAAGASDTSEPRGESSRPANTTDWPPLEGASSSEITSSTTGEQESTSETGTDGETSTNVCDEVVPAELFVDGIPAYSQCDASESAGIWSSDGISTSTEQPNDWRRTQWGGGYQCTEFASRYLYFVWGVDSVPNGNAGSWCDSEPPDGLVQAPTPVHGDLIVFAPGSCGASAETGHVAVVDVVDEDASRVEIVEQNRAGRRRTDFDCAACFLHAVANDAQ